jgi:hypothetical protein
LGDLNLRALQELPSLQEIGILLEVDTESQPAATLTVAQQPATTQSPAAEPATE